MDLSIDWSDGTMSVDIDFDVNLVPNVKDIIANLESQEKMLIQRINTLLELK